MAGVVMVCLSVCLFGWLRKDGREWLAAAVDLLACLPACLPASVDMLVSTHTLMWCMSCWLRVVWCFVGTGCCDGPKMMHSSMAVE